MWNVIYFLQFNSYLHEKRFWQKTTNNDVAYSNSDN